LRQDDSVAASSSSKPPKKYRPIPIAEISILGVPSLVICELGIPIHGFGVGLLFGIIFLTAKFIFIIRHKKSPFILLIHYMTMRFWGYKLLFIDIGLS
jgi:uncharacterized membrane protein